MSGHTLTDKTRHNWGIFARVLAAAVGGYALTTLLSFLLLAGLPVEEGNAKSTAQLASYLIWTAIIIRVFAGRSALRVWTELALACAIAGLACWLIAGGAA